MQSAPKPRPTTNPYITMLSRSLSAEPELDLLHFSWWSALTRRIDVFHAHWPEILVSGASPAKKLVRQGLFVLLLAKFTLTGTAVVRTVHNVDLPSGISRRERALLRMFDRRTDFRIRINPTTAVRDGQPFMTILHGHYRDWFSDHPARSREPGHLAYFGLIRRYKGTEHLVEVFRDVPESSGLSLAVAGRPSSEELVRDITALADGDHRITTHLAFLTDAELVETATRAELVVLPYREMHNSGGALTALSLDRPVLVPDNPATRSLAEEVGKDWVRTYKDGLTVQDLVEAAHHASTLRDSRPDLNARDWSESARLHVEAFRRAAGARG